VSGSARYLLDTNVLSETRKHQANAGVLSFLSAQDSEALYICVMTMGELRKGVEMKRKTDQDAAQRLSDWVDGLEHMYADRIVPIDSAAARLWGELSSDKSRPVVHTLLAATALVRQLTLVTRDTADLTGIPVQLLDPWQ
jgi:predicted nucleic acid-binding protein